jgi:hypothetical protein
VKVRFLRFHRCPFRLPQSANPDGCRVGAGEEIRTLDIFLGKEVLYQLSYARVNEGAKVGETAYIAQGVF